MTILFILIKLKIISKEYNINRISLIKKFFLQSWNWFFEKSRIKKK